MAIKAMSPQETSKWCTSLALCGVRGRVLGDLQEQIVRRQIDGFCFDRMLRSNALKDLDIEELNPRLALAIRRSWTTDFGTATFVEYDGGHAHGSHHDASSNNCYGGGYGQPTHDMQRSPASDTGKRPSFARGSGLDNGFIRDSMSSTASRSAHSERTAVPWATSDDNMDFSASQERRNVYGGGIKASNDARDRKIATEAVPWATSDGGMDFSSTQERRSAYGGGFKAADDARDRTVAACATAAARSEAGSSRSGAASRMAYEEESRNAASMCSSPQQHLWGGSAGPRGGGSEIGGPLSSPGYGGYERRDVGAPPLRGSGSCAGCGGHRAETDGGSCIPDYPSATGSFRGVPSGARGNLFNARSQHEEEMGYTSMRSPSQQWNSAIGQGGGRSAHDNGLPPQGRPWEAGQRQPEAVSAPPWSEHGGYPDQFATGSPSQTGERYHRAVGHLASDACGGGSFPSRMAGGKMYHGSLPSHMTNENSDHGRAGRMAEYRMPHSHMPDDFTPPASPTRGGGRSDVLGHGASLGPPAHDLGEQRWRGQSFSQVPGPDDGYVERRPFAAEMMRSGGEGFPARSTNDDDQWSSHDVQNWGGGLDQMCPPRYSPGPNVANPRRAPEGPPRHDHAIRTQSLREEVADDWNGMSVDDAFMPPKRRDISNSGTAHRDGPSGRSSEAHLRLDFDDENERHEIDFDPRPKSESKPATSNITEVIAARGRNRRQPPATDDDGWGGHSLSDALASKEVPPAATRGAGSLNSANRQEPAFRARGSIPAPAVAPSASSSGSTKTPEDIVAWVRTLPESHVPEKSRNNLIAIVEESRYTGADFSDYVQRVPPEVCAPKHAMKLKAAWKNVLNESVVTEAALTNLASQPKQKATMIVC